MEGDVRGDCLSDNPARPPAGTQLCALEDLADPGSKGFRFRHERLLFAGFVIRIGEEVRGYVDSCPHAGWPLSALPDRYLTRAPEQIAARLAWLNQHRPELVAMKDKAAQHAAGYSWKRYGDVIVDAIRALD